MNVYPPLHLPLVSVIIPMYNVEKYIAELLDSVLAQTFTDFEVIVVDNGSTDNSAAIVESYVPKFEGRLNILKFEKNTGRPVKPRNWGLEFSRGKYIFFMDSDDVLTEIALEAMCAFAEEFQVDVVQFLNRYISEGVGKDFLKNAKLREDSQIKVPCFINNDFAEKVSVLNQGILGMPPWLKFSRRDFLIENKIKFREIFRDDDMWTLEVLFCAKKFLLVPTACVIHRMRDDALTYSKNRPLNKNLRHWLDRTINGLNLLNDFLGKFEFFRENPNYCYAIFNSWVSFDLQFAFQFCATLPPHQIYEIFKNEFEKDLGANGVLVSCLVCNVITLMKSNLIMQEKIEQLEN